MKISIITATYDSGRTLRDTLESILAQTYTDYEVLIIDGGSRDNTKEIVDGSMPRCGGKLKWYSGPDDGLYDAMNKGIALTTGDVVGILNSDDFYADSDVLRLIAEGCADVDAVYGDLDFVDPGDTSRIVRQWRGSQHFRGGFLQGWHPAHPTFYVRRECFGRFGVFDTSFEVSADFELMLRFIEREGISTRYIPHTFVKMRMGGKSTGALSNIIRGNCNVMRAFRKNGFEVSWLYPVKRLAPKAIDMIRHKLKL